MSGRSRHRETRRRGDWSEKSFYEGKVAAASFFAKNFLPLLTSTRSVIDNLDNDVMELDEAAF